MIPNSIRSVVVLVKRFGGRRVGAGRYLQVDAVDDAASAEALDQSGRRQRQVRATSDRVHPTSVRDREVVPPTRRPYCFPP